MAFSCSEKKSKKTDDERRYSGAYISPDSSRCRLERVVVIFHHTVQHENIISITEHRRSSVMWNDSHESVEILEDVMRLGNVNKT